jgi:hypothetical protein
MHFVCAVDHGAEERTTPAPTPMPGACPDGYATWADKCFKVVDDKLKWSEAKAHCLQDDTSPFSLASIHDHWETCEIRPQNPEMRHFVLHLQISSSRSW